MRWGDLFLNSPRICGGAARHSHPEWVRVQRCVLQALVPPRNPPACQPQRTRLGIANGNNHTCHTALRNYKCSHLEQLVLIP